jgi:hypothetical protein
MDSSCRIERRIGLGETQLPLKAAGGGYILSGFLFVGTMLGFGQTTPDPWLLLASNEKGAINSHTTRDELVRAYGKANVVDQEVDVGEGETEPGTVIFPSDPKRSIEILWQDPEKKTHAASAQVQGEASLWKAPHGISLGTSLKQLEQLNARPFRMAGFEWDYSGTVTSWENGLLATALDGEHGRVVVRLDSRPGTNVSQQEQSQVLGDGDFSSHHPVMQKLNPVAYQIIWVFPSPAQK